MEGFATAKRAQHKRFTVYGNENNSSREREFEKLYLDSYGLVYNFVRYRMPNSSAAEDIVSEAYMKAARAFSSYDPVRAKFSTWVVQIAKNCIVSYYRKEHSTVDLEEAPQQVYAVPDEQSFVDEKDYVSHLLACLSAEERELIAMKYHEGMRNVEIAEALGMNASTVSTKLAKALSKLRTEALRSE